MGYRRSSSGSPLNLWAANSGHFNVDGLYLAFTKLGDGRDPFKTNQDGCL